MSMSEAQSWVVIILGIGTALSSLIVAVISAYKTVRVQQAVQSVADMTNGRLSTIEGELRAAKGDLAQAYAILRESERARLELVAASSALATKVEAATAIPAPEAPKVIQP